MAGSWAVAGITLWISSRKRTEACHLFFLVGKFKNLKFKIRFLPRFFKFHSLYTYPLIYIFQSLSAASKNLTQSIVLVSGYHLISHTGGQAVRIFFAHQHLTNKELCKSLKCCGHFLGLLLLLCLLRQIPLMKKSTFRTVRSYLILTVCCTCAYFQPSPLFPTVTRACVRRTSNIYIGRIGFLLPCFQKSLRTITSHAAQYMVYSFHHERQTFANKVTDRLIMHMPVAIGTIAHFLTERWSCIVVC